MKLAFIGLGKMGYEMAGRLKRQGHEPVCFDLSSENREKGEEAGLTVKASAVEATEELPSPKVILLMIPAGDPVDDCILQMEAALQAGDIIVDCGNSNFNDSKRRYEYLKKKKIAFIDCGTSGGIEGARDGACLMVGGEEEAVSHCEPLFLSLARENGYRHVGGPSGGHYLKMVHNGIEYGMMQAIAEGYELLKKSPYGYSFKEVTDLFNNGSIIESYLLEALGRAFEKDADLSAIKGVMQSSGEGKWTLETALDLSVCTPVIALSQMMRYRSLEEDTFSGKVVAALRNEFGGHAVTKK